MTTADGAWVYDGKKKEVLLENASGTESFSFRIVISLSDNTAQTSLNGEELGTFPLKTKGKASVLTELRFATTDADKLKF